MTKEDLDKWRQRAKDWCNCIGTFDRFKKKTSMWLSPTPHTWDMNLGEDAWYDPIASEALKILQKKDKKWKDYELSAMGPGNSKNYMDMAIMPIQIMNDGPKKNWGEPEFKVHFNPKTDKVTKVEHR